ncbi:MAG: hypothetical protein RTU92_05050 [Candidatus Thorarchaeota archaeon]
MANSKKRYIGPTFLFLIGAYIAVQLILTVTEAFPPIASDVLAFLPADNLGQNIVTIMAIGIPIMVIEYLIIAVPIAAIILFVTRLYKSASYEINIMSIGHEFGASRMLRRAAAPALFSLAFAGMFKDPIQQFLFDNPDPAALLPAEVQIFYPIVLSLMSAALFSLVAIALFTPTWVLNDSGIVTHLKPHLMTTRRCPDTQGVGRWISNILGGYGVIAYPITAFTNHFWNPLIAPILDGTSIHIQGGLLRFDLLGFDLMISLLWTLGLPFFIMALIMPVIFANEAYLNRAKKRVAKLALRFGARVIKKEEIKEIKRPKLFQDLKESEPVSKGEGTKIDRKKKVEPTVVTSAKKRPKKKPDKKKKK